MSFIAVHPNDDVLVALESYPRGSVVDQQGHSFTLIDEIPAKHKVAVREIAADESVRMYGITVARARRAIQAGQLVTPANVVNATDDVASVAQAVRWQPPDVSRWRDRTFDGYRREDGRVGTRNYWIVVPLVFCENRNLQVMRDAMVGELGYATHHGYRQQTRALVDLYASGNSAEAILATTLSPKTDSTGSRCVFPNVDGIKFLSHEGGCGGAYEDAQNLCGLLAGYINHPNVAGATVLSLGCQKAQLADLQQQLHRRNPRFNKPLLVFEQQRMASEESMLSEAIKQTFVGLMAANEARREPVALSHLVVGLECGGSDGFSGISANPAIGHCSDLLVQLGGSVILSEFPELSGCESDLAARCTEPDVAERFLKLMRTYEARCIAEGNSFEGNPSPGNIRDGLITNAIKAAGAARKGGTSPVVDALDYPEPVTRAGLNLLCTPGGDVESTTAKVGSGANALLFSTGLGTPTGNPIAPVIKVSSNTALAHRMSDIIDCDAGSIVTAAETIEQVGERLLDELIATASGRRRTKAELLGQDDFIPWRRSLTF